MHPPSPIIIPPVKMGDIEITGPPPNETNEHKAPKLASSNTPLLAQRLKTLFETSQPRSAGAAHVIVIAVDGLERSPVDALLRLLEKYIIEQIKPSKPGNVRVCPGSRPPSIQPIHHWDLLWKYFSDEASDRDKIHIIIVGFAPLMAMQKVSALCPLHDIYAEQANWKRLAQEWQGRIQPDITIIVQQYDKNLEYPTVLPVHETKTLMIPQTGERDPFIKLQLNLLQVYVEHWLNELLPP